VLPERVVMIAMRLVTAVLLNALSHQTLALDKKRSAGVGFRVARTFCLVFKHSSAPVSSYT